MAIHETTTAPETGTMSDADMERFVQDAKTTDFKAWPDATLENLDRSGKSARYDPVFRIAFIMLSKTKEELTDIARELPETLVDVATKTGPLAKEYRDAADLLDTAFARIGVALAMNALKNEAIT